MAQMHSSHSSVRKIAYTASLGSSSSSGFSTHLLQLVGQWVIKTFWAAQSTSGLWCNSQGCPMITDCCPRLVMANHTLSECFPKQRQRKEGMDFFCGGAMFIGRAIYVIQQDRLREWSGLKLMFPYKVMIDKHSGCSGIQEGGG